VAQGRSEQQSLQEERQSMTEYIQVFTTIDAEEGAAAIAHAIVARRLAGCVQILGPIRSTYWWEGEIEVAQEWICLIKTSQEAYPDLEAALKEIHPYDTPEILALPVVAGNADYLRWLQQELGDGRGRS
jgi:periplasmic divalent cation tolerance protein